MAHVELQKVVMQEEHDEERRRLELMNTDLQTNCTEMGVKYAKKILELLVAEAKLIQAEGLCYAKIPELRREISQ